MYNILWTSYKLTQPCPTERDALVSIWRLSSTVNHPCKALFAVVFNTATLFCLVPEV